VFQRGNEFIQPRRHFPAQRDKAIDIAKEDRRCLKQVGSAMGAPGITDWLAQ
jgi:hypothetical protein